jgi:hypothetical protein
VLSIGCCGICWGVVKPTNGGFATNPGIHEYANIEEGAKEAGKEHHFGEDKPQHTQHIRMLELWAGETAHIFVNDDAPPFVQNAGHNQ